jgi:hypothetical protein
VSDQPAQEEAGEGDGFLIMFPCFAIMNKKCTGGVVLPQPDGQIAIVILTDEALLKAYRVEHKLIGPTVRFEFAFQLWLYLCSLPPSITLVAFDPGKASFVAYPIAKLKAFLWQRIEEAGGEPDSE